MVLLRPGKAWRKKCNTNTQFPSHLASSLKRARTTSTIYESWAIVVRHWELALHQWKIRKSTTTEDLHFPYTEGG